MAHVTISLEQIACTDQHVLIGLVWSEVYSDRRSHVLHRRSDHFLKFRWSTCTVQEFRRSEVRSKCTDRGSLGDRQASVQFDRRNLGDRRPHISAQVAVFLTAKMAWRTPKLPDRTDRRPLSYSIGVLRRLSELQRCWKFDIFFPDLSAEVLVPNYDRSTRSNCNRKPHGFLFDRVVLDRSSSRSSYFCLSYRTSSRFAPYRLFDV